MTKTKAKAPPTLDKLSRELADRLPGLVVRRAPSVLDEEAFVAITLSYRADKDKDSTEWLVKQMAKMPDMRAFRREYLLDWTSAEGKAFYPDFADSPERYVSSSVVYEPSLPVYRGFDFGFRHPAAVWVQVLPNGRVHVLHDVLPSDIDTYSFRDLVLYLSGQTLDPGLSYDQERELRHLAKTPRAYHYASLFHKERPWWEGMYGDVKEYPVPFFPPGVVFSDFSGPEAYKVSATVEGNKRERTDAEVFESGGIYLDCAYQSVEAGETLIRKILLDMDDGLPGLMCSPAAVNTINALAGGLVYAKPTAVNARPENAAKDGLFEHVHDAIRYVATHVVDPNMDLTRHVVPEVYREESELREAERQAVTKEDEWSEPWESRVDWNDLDSFV